MEPSGICLVGPHGGGDLIAADRPRSLPDARAFFESDGFAFVRQRGDHLIYTKVGVKRPLVIPTYRSVPVFIIRNLLRTAGMSRERYFQLLEA